MRTNLFISLLTLSVIVGGLSMLFDMLAGNEREGRLKFVAGIGYAVFIWLFVDSNFLKKSFAAGMVLPQIMIHKIHKIHNLHSPLMIHLIHQIHFIHYQTQIHMIHKIHQLVNQVNEVNVVGGGKGMPKPELDVVLTDPF